MQKTIKTRIQNKHDIQANWERAINFIPLAGELIVYDADYDAVSNPNGYKYPRFKIGDGVVNAETNVVEGTNVNDLPFYAGSWNDLSDQPDLDIYALKSEILTKTSELENDAKFITAAEIPDEYITEQELNNKGYLTEHQDISHLAEKAELFSGSYNDLSDKPSIPSIAGLASENFVNNSITTHNTKADAHSDIRILITELTTRLNTVANSTDEDLNQLSEIVAYIKNNKSLIDGITTNKVNVSDIINNLTTNVANKPLSAAQGVELKALIDTLQSELDLHGHEISEVAGLQDALDSKAAASHGTHVTFSTTAPVVDGTASAGSANTVARSDHKHPTDTTRAAQADLTSHTNNTTVHITSAERTDWNAAKTHAGTAHAPSNAEHNVIVGIQKNGTDVSVDSTTRKVNITVPTKVSELTNDSGFKTTDTTYSAGTGISLSGTTFSNAGVRSIATGTANGTISVNTNGTAADVAVKGLGSAAYTASTAYDAAGAAATALTNAKGYTDEKVASIISCGTADPSSSVTSQFYFKYATE